MTSQSQDIFSILLYYAYGKWYFQSNIGRFGLIQASRTKLENGVSLSTGMVEQNGKNILWLGGQLASLVKIEAKYDFKTYSTQDNVHAIEAAAAGKRKGEDTAPVDRPPIWGHLSCQSVKIPTKCKTRSVPAFFDTQPKSFFYKEKSFVQAYWTVFLRGQRRIYCHVASLLCQWFHSVAKYSVHLLLTFEKWFELKSSIFHNGCTYNIKLGNEM